MSRPRLMRATLAACVVTAATVAAAVAQQDIGATDVLYMAGSTWAAERPDTKLALSRAFMRIFCTDARMAPERLVACIDADGRTDPIFERAITCSALLDRS